MNALALLLVLSVAAPEPSCLARKSTVSTSTIPTFVTELECELWEAVVLLESDVRTATSALALCVEAVDEVAPEAVELATDDDAIETREGSNTPSSWAAFGLGGVALGIVVGVVVSRIEVKL